MMSIVSFQYILGSIVPLMKVSFVSPKLILGHLAIRLQIESALTQK